MGFSVVRRDHVFQLGFILDGIKKFCTMSLEYAPIRTVGKLIKLLLIVFVGRNRWEVGDRKI